MTKKPYFPVQNTRAAPADAPVAEPVALTEHEREMDQALFERDEREEVINNILDEVLSPNRAEWSSAYGFADAIEDVKTRMWSLTRPPAPAAEVAEPVGEAGTMPGTSGFTMACFKAADVPIGTKLYTRPPAPEDAKDAARKVLNRAEILSIAGNHFINEGPGSDRYRSPGQLCDVSEDGLVLFAQEIAALSQGGGA